MTKKVVRNAAIHSVCLVGHRSSGKTSVAEMLLHHCGVVRSPGRVDDGSTLLDFEAEERARHQSLRPAFAWMKVGEKVVFLADTPGAKDLHQPSAMAASGCDAQVIVVSGPDGVESGTERWLRGRGTVERPRYLLVNKVDRGVNLEAITSEVESLTSARAVPMQLPFYDDEGTFAGVVDILSERVLRYSMDESGALSEEPVPDRLKTDVAAAREYLFESAALADDELLEEYFEYLELTIESAWRGLQIGVENGSIIPVMLSSAPDAVGAGPFLDLLGKTSPQPNIPETQSAFVAQRVASRLDEDGKLIHILRVWKGEIPHRAVWVNQRTGERQKIQKLYVVRGSRRASAKQTPAGMFVATWEPLPGEVGDVFTDGREALIEQPQALPHMAWLTIRAKDARSERGLEGGLCGVRQLDNSWSYSLHEGYADLKGASLGQLQGVVRQVRSYYGLNVETSLPEVNYRERPVGSAHEVHGLYSRTSNGCVEEYGEVWIDAQPVEGEEQFIFEGEVDEDVLPPRFVPPVGEGARRALKTGPYAGFPVIGVRVVCTSGEYDVLESEPEHFEEAGARAMRSALEQMGTEILEPWSALCVTVPADEVGGVLADLSSHRARIQDVDVGASHATIKALSPARELHTLSTRLDSLTKGRGWFTVEPSHYARLPKHLLSEVPRKVGTEPTLERT